VIDDTEIACPYCSEIIEKDSPRRLWEYASEGKLVQFPKYVWAICRKCGRTSVYSGTDAVNPPFESNLCVPWYCKECQVAFLSRNGTCAICGRVVGDEDDD
jgi:ribosomal protein L37E